MDILNVLITVRKGKPRHVFLQGTLGGNHYHAQIQGDSFCIRQTYEPDWVEIVMAARFALESVAFRDTLFANLLGLPIFVHIDVP